MPRHLPSKSDYTRYVKKFQKRAKTNTHRLTGCSWISTRALFRPTITTEKDYFSDKYQNVVRSYQNLVFMDEYQGRSQEEWRWLHYQRVGVTKSFSTICECLERTTISNNKPKKVEESCSNLSEVSKHFGHDKICADLDPLKPSDYKVLHFSESGPIESFLDFIIRG